MKHNHDELRDWDKLGEMLEREAEVSYPYLDQATLWLQGIRGSAERVLDVGSGPGVASCLLAARYPDASVVAVDSAPALLEQAGARAARLGVRVRTQLATLPEQIGELGQTDVIWIGQVLHHLGDQQAALTALGELLRPGGVLALVEGGLPNRFLPRDIGIGRPGLLARLDVAAEDSFSVMREELPGTVAVPEDWPALLDRAGLKHAGTRTFLIDHPSPVDQKTRAHALLAIERLATYAGESLSTEDRATVARLLDPEDEASVLRRPDVFMLGAKTVHLATTR